MERLRQNLQSKKTEFFANLKKLFISKESIQKTKEENFWENFHQEHKEASQELDRVKKEFYKQKKDVQKYIQEEGALQTTISIINQTINGQTGEITHLLDEISKTLSTPLEKLLVINLTYELFLIFYNKLDQTNKKRGQFFRALEKDSIYASLSKEQKTWCRVKMNEIIDQFFEALN